MPRCTLEQAAARIRVTPAGGHKHIAPMQGFAQPVEHTEGVGALLDAGLAVPDMTAPLRRDDIQGDRQLPRGILPPAQIVERLEERRVGLAGGKMDMREERGRKRRTRPCCWSSD